MDIYIAVRDNPVKFGTSSIIGAFSAEEAARAACQEDAESDGLGALIWEDTRTAECADLSRYDVIMCSLGERIGETRPCNAPHCKFCGNDLLPDPESPNGWIGEPSWFCHAAGTGREHEPA